MTTRALKSSELIDYADHHSGTVYTPPGQLNPYKVGLELFREIEDRWNKGRFGKAYDDCDDLGEKKRWDLRLGKGREKIFEVRRHYNDITFIDEFLTEEFCAIHKLFVYDYNPDSRRWEISSRDFGQVKKRLLQQLTNLGSPVLRVIDGNYENRGELLIEHLHDGVDLDRAYAQSTMSNLQRIWNRPVHVATLSQDKGILLSFDGQTHKERVL
jgi:stage V sporulation protein R